MMLLPAPSAAPELMLALTFARSVMLPKAQSAGVSHAVHVLLPSAQNAPAGHTDSVELFAQ